MKEDILPSQTKKEKRLNFDDLEEDITANDERIFKNEMVKTGKLKEEAIRPPKIEEKKEGRSRRDEKESKAEKVEKDSAEDSKSLDKEQEKDESRIEIASAITRKKDRITQKERKDLKKEIKEDREAKKPDEDVLEWTKKERKAIEEIEKIAGSSDPKNRDRKKEIIKEINEWNNEELSDQLLDKSMDELLNETVIGLENNIRKQEQREFDDQGEATMSMIDRIKKDHPIEKSIKSEEKTLDDVEDENKKEERKSSDESAEKREFPEMTETEAKQFDNQVNLRKEGVDTSFEARDEVTKLDALKIKMEANYHSLQATKRSELATRQNLSKFQKLKQMLGLKKGESEIEKECRIKKERSQIIREVFRENYEAYMQQMVAEKDPEFKKKALGRDKIYDKLVREFVFTEEVVEAPGSNFDKKSGERSEKVSLFEDYTKKLQEIDGMEVENESEKDEKWYAKTWERYLKLPKAKKLALGAFLSGSIGAAVGTASGFGAAGALGYGAWKASKRAAMGVAGGALSKGVDIKMKKKIGAERAERKEEMEGKIAERLNLKEAGALELFEDELKKQKKENIKRLAAVGVSAGGLSFLAVNLEGVLSGDVDSMSIGEKGKSLADEAQEKTAVEKTVETKEAIPETEKARPPESSIDDEAAEVVLENEDSLFRGEDNYSEINADEIASLTELQKDNAEHFVLEIERLGEKYEKLIEEKPKLKFKYQKVLNSHVNNLFGRFTLANEMQADYETVAEKLARADEGRITPEDKRESVNILLSHIAREESGGKDNLGRKNLMRIIKRHSR